MALFTISGSVVTTGLEDNTIPSGPFTGSFVTTGAGPIFTIAGGGITSFLVSVPVGAVITSPFPNVIFDAVAQGAAVSYNATTQTLTVDTLVSTIVSGTVPAVGYPFPILLDLGTTQINVPAAVSIRPVEGTFATGSYTFATTVSMVPSQTAGGGMGCLPQCIDPCRPMSVDIVNRFARVLAKGAMILAAGSVRRG